jgi:PAS domain-containing protein
VPKVQFKTQLRLRTKIMLWFVLLVGLQGVLFTVLADLLFRFEFKEMVRSRGMHLSESILIRGKDLLLTGDIVRLHTLLQEEKSNTPGMRYAFVLDHEGNLVAHTFRGGLPMVLLSVHSPGIGTGARLVRVSNELLYDLQTAKAWGTLRLGISLSDVEGTTLRIRVYVILATLASIVAVFLLALMISHPVERLAVFAADGAVTGRWEDNLEFLNLLETTQLFESFNDVTRQLRSRIDVLTDSEASVRRRKDFVENLQENLGLGIVALSADNGIQFANRLACTLLEIAPGRALTDLGNVISLEGPDKDIVYLVRSRRPFQGLWRVRNGSACSIKGIPIRNPDGSESMLLKLESVVEDIEAS